MKIFGLTGGIASGKSTVAQMFRHLGVPTLDADGLYHDLISPRDGQPSELAQAIARAFPGVLHESGAIDRAALGQKIFHDQAAREELNQITHPAVGKAFLEAVTLERARGAELMLYDVPLLYEAGKEKEFDGVIVVWVPEDVQRARLCTRNDLSVSQANARLQSQLSLDDKRRRADHVIDNSADLAKTEKQVKELLSLISPA